MSALCLMKVDDSYAIEWAYIPHFYNSFYVYQYATTVAAGSMFAAEILKTPNHFVRVSFDHDCNSECGRFLRL